MKKSVLLLVVGVLSWALCGFTLYPSPNQGGPVSLTSGVSGILPLANGGSNAALTASNGGIFYSTATAGAILSGTATANQALLSGLSTTPAWSTATYPPTTVVSQLLYSSATNVIGGLATGNNGVLITSGTGVPSISSTIPSATQDNITRLGTIATGFDVLANVFDQVRTSDLSADATAKAGFYLSRHYTNAEENFGLVLGRSTATTNILNLGGSSTGLNAATDITFWTAANNTTVTGTQRMVIDSTGNVGIGDTSPASLLTAGNGDLFQVNSTGSIAAVVNITSSGQFTTTVATGTAPLVITSTTAVANLTTIPAGGVFSPSGTQLAGAKIIANQCTLDGAATATCTITVAYTSATSYRCTIATETNTNSVRVVRTNSTTVTVTSAVTLDTGVVNLICAGN